MSSQHPTAVCARVQQLVDADSFRPLDECGTVRLADFPIPRPYREVLATAAESSGSTESVVVGSARIGGHVVALAVFDFSFLGGTLGVAAGTRLVRLLESAIPLNVPFVLVSATGGVRVQEGPAALAQMPRVAAAVARHRAAGLVQVTVLDDPTYGGVGAGFALAADVLVATPGARVGFLGPRVTGRPSLMATPLASRLADAEVPAEHQRRWLAGLLDVLNGRANPRTDPVRGTPVADWTAVLGDALDGGVALTGARRGERPRAVSAGLGAVAKCRIAWLCVGASEDGTGPGPYDYGHVQRVLDLAGRLRLPVVAVLDTPGADASLDADAGNVAGEIALTTMAFAAHPHPTLTVLAGEAGSGGAMALAGADRVVADAAARLEVLTSRAAASLLLRDAERADEVRPWLGADALSLLERGLVDEIAVSGIASTLRGVLRRFVMHPPSVRARLDRWEKISR